MVLILVVRRAFVVRGRRFRESYSTRLSASSTVANGARGESPFVTVAKRLVNFVHEHR
jgi:hypothetical protein